jgi:hypothetical protein
VSVLYGVFDVRVLVYDVHAVYDDDDVRLCAVYEFVEHPAFYPIGIKASCVRVVVFDPPVVCDHALAARPPPRSGGM